MVGHGILTPLTKGLHTPYLMVIGSQTEPGFSHLSPRGTLHKSSLWEPLHREVRDALLYPFMARSSVRSDHSCLPDYNCMLSFAAICGADTSRNRSATAPFQTAGNAESLGQHTLRKAPDFHLWYISQQMPVLTKRHNGRDVGRERHLSTQTEHDQTCSLHLQLLMVKQHEPGFGIRESINSCSLIFSISTIALAKS